MQVSGLPLSTDPLSAATDRELLDAWASSRSNRHFTELVRRYLGLVRGIALRQTGADHADDVAQLTFAILARKAPDLTDIRSLGAWLHRVAVLQCRSAVRRQIRERRDLHAAMEHARSNDARDPLAEALPYLDDAIGSLKDSDRELIHLRYSEGLTFPEVARRTGRSEAALRQQASRAVEKLAGLLRRRGVEVPAATIATGLGATLAGNSSASAAGIIAASAISSSATIGSGAMALVTLFTMSTTKTILSAALLAALLVGGPVIWKAAEIHELEKELAASQASSRLPTERVPAPHPSRPERTRATRERTELNLPPGTEQQQMEAVGKLIEAEFKASLTDWLMKKAEIDSRRTALAIGLSPAKEEALRLFLSKQVEELLASPTLGFDQHEARAKKRAEEKARVDDWFAANLTPEQTEARKKMDDEMMASTTERMAEDSLYEVSSKVLLTEEQKTRLFQIASAQAAEAVRKNDHSYHVSTELVFSSEIQPSVEELSADEIQRVLSPDQQQLWEQARKRDEVIRETLPNRLVEKAAIIFRSPVGEKILDELKNH